jgi:PleD family two-component response regulator
VGVIEFASFFHDFEEMFIKMDEALYQAKHEKDKVVLAS